MSKVLTAAERKELEDEIARNPERWPVVAGTGGARKARVKREAQARALVEAARAKAREEKGRRGKRK